MNIDDLATLLGRTKKEIIKELNDKDVLSVSLSEKETKKRQEKLVIIS